MDAILLKIAQFERGPGAALAILKDGEVVAKHAYGFADLDRHIQLTTSTQLPICSISKQMVCLVLADLIKNPTAAMSARGKDVSELMTEELHRLLPGVSGSDLKVAHVYNMQSGIRDYWAMTTIWGARPDGSFSLAHDAPESLKRVKSFHFEPGTEFSYSNVNFHVLARLIENVSGVSLGQLLAERVFIPAGMKTALLSANTSGHPLPCVGYEGDEKRGYLPATNRIEWSGDAGIVASLKDMIAYEKYLNRSWEDPKSNYRCIAEPQSYKDGSPATYGFGLGRGEVDGKITLGHGGALRGYRLHRIHVPEERVSVVVMFNHETDAGGAADYILKQALQWEKPVSALNAPSPEWKGCFLDDATQLLIQVESENDKEVAITYAGHEEKPKLTGSNTAESKTMLASIDGDTLRIERKRDHRTLKATRVSKLEKSDLAQHLEDCIGEYRCEESDSFLRCIGAGGVLYGSFTGFLGQGPLHIMRPIAKDIWLLADPRGMDAPAPGDWTVVYGRSEDGKIKTVTVGCWLARRLEFVKVC
ncbi:D-aminopeptidase [Pseudocercospora fuligena]|uniref:D-aminopeptidase n=1 Tax=Pseudocercospora fuligena TaxID=685502 RepID=A0A8H6VFT3_9PEZI|nr:D-aminopeptidase [Pseudocercospora fuligena]